MVKLEDLTVGASVRGLSPTGAVRILLVEWYGDVGIKVSYELAPGRVEQEVLYRDAEPRLELEQPGRAWSFDGDGQSLRLASEAKRIKLAHLFDPYLAVHTSRIEPLPHQITAVYGEMLDRQPLRFLLADDPGAGKTIMAGLLIKELALRSDLERCLILAPGSLVEQWQDELSEKFGLGFDILTRDQVEASRTGNPFTERPCWVARMDMLSRAEDLQALLTAAPEFDLIVCDEAHRMSASRFGDEVKYTQRHQLGQLLGTRCRHFLLLSATPHNGKDDDFQLFMSLLDGDRFEGRIREGTRQVDVSDLMRRLTKEELRKFDGTPLFPERRAYTARYELSPAEAALYTAVTDYVREEMNRADRIEGDGKRRVNVGFALQALQRRLASSPEAIYQSLRRRRERLERRLEEENLRRRGQDAALSPDLDLGPGAPDDDTMGEAPEAEIEQAEDDLMDQATAARTVAELRTEIASLHNLEAQAHAVRRSNQDAKWRQLESILDHPLMTGDGGQRRKFIIFTEPRDTLSYLATKIRNRLGRQEAVVVIHGGVGREDRRKAIELFMNDPGVLAMVANDAAGEGVNLQRAHLMVNYDLPWNPNRIEQRFGRIHRIGQIEVCHLWNLVAVGTREGDVYARLLDKLDAARDALGGRVFDVLGRLFEGEALRDLLVQAVRYGDDPEVRARLTQAVDGAVDRDRLLDLLADRALVHNVLSQERITEIRQEIERAAARRLQPHFIRDFFLDAFQRLGGRISRREPGRWEISHVPIGIRRRDRQIGRGEPVLDRYERICFDKADIPGPPLAKFICPGHPLLDAVIDLIDEQHGASLKHGAALVDDQDGGREPRALAYLQHSVRDARTRPNGQPNIISERLQFVELGPAGAARDAGPAPYLDYRPLKPEERDAVANTAAAPWLAEGLAAMAERFAITRLVPEHLAEVRGRRLPEIEKEESEVEARLRREILHWDHRAQDLRQRERAGKETRLSAQVAESRANELQARLRHRQQELALARSISAAPPVIVGGALVIPAGLLRSATDSAPAGFSEASADVERLAMDSVMAAERALGCIPRDVSAAKVGYDIESIDPRSGRLRFIEVKGRAEGADVIIVTRNEILTALNAADAFILAVVQISNGFAHQPSYIRRPFIKEPDPQATAVVYRLQELLVRANVPALDS